MFNIIIEKCPEVVNISGHLFSIETDFKSILTMLTRLELSDDSEFAGKMALRTFFKDNIPNDIELAIDVLQAFLEEDPNQIQFDDEVIEEDEVEEQERFFSMVYDSNYIYSAFMQIYHIDLTSVNMHWWKFKALISGLPGDTKLSDIISIRSQELPKDSKSRSAVTKLKEIYKLPEKDKHDEKKAIDAFDALFNWSKS